MSLKIDKAECKFHGDISKSIIHIPVIENRIVKDKYYCPFCLLDCIDTLFKTVGIENSLEIKYSNNDEEDEILST